MRIVWIGFHYEGLDAFRAVLESGVRIDAFITLLPELAAKRSGSSDYAVVCERYHVPVHHIRNINDHEAVDLLRSLAPDVAFVIGWTQIVRPDALSTARFGMIGAHASLLPRNRGRAPINWSLIKGENETGNTLIWLSEGVDEGAIIEQTRFAISPYDTCDTLYRKVAESNRAMILNAISALRSGTIARSPQGDSAEPPLPGRTPEQGAIDWRAPAHEVYNFIRALTHPYPGAFSSFKGRRYLIWSAALLPLESVTATPGYVLGPVVSPDPSACGQLVACGRRGAVVILDVETPNGDRIRGHALSDQQWTGEVFTSE